MVNTTGVRTNATCTAPTSLQLDTSTGTTNYTITSQSSSNCNITVPFNPRDANQQYGVSGVPNCGPNASMNQTFWPVFFWFYRNNSGTPQAAGTFCAPTLEVFVVSANASMSDGSLGNVTIIAPIGANNNVTGAPQMGIPFNGLDFLKTSLPYTAHPYSFALLSELYLISLLMTSLLQGPQQSITEFQAPYYKLFKQT